MAELDEYEPTGLHMQFGRKVIKGLHPGDYRKLASSKELTTDAGAAAYMHRVREPRATALRCNAHSPWTEDEAHRIDDIYRALDTLTLLQVDMQVGKGEPSCHVRLCVPKHHADLAYLAAQSLAPSPVAWIEHQSPDITVIALPEWGKVCADPGPCILIDGDGCIAYILGTDNYGDIRDAFLGLAAHRANRQGRLALSAAAIELWARSYQSGEITRRGLLFLGPYGAGKSTSACHEFDLDTTAGEKVRIRQDGVVFVDANGDVHGAEGRGAFVRTEGLNLEDHPVLYDACSARDVALENVWVGGDGLVDYFDTTHTHYGRAVVPMHRIRNADGEIEMPPFTDLFLLTRNPWSPAVAKLTPEQAAAAFMLGESMPSRPTEADTPECITREAAPGAPGIRPAEDDVNALYELLNGTPEMSAYLLNTAAVGVGENARNVRQLDTACIIREICRDGIEWQKSDTHDFEVPVAVPGMDIEPFRVESCFEAERLGADLTKLRSDRERWLGRFENLDSQVRSATFS